MSAAPAGSLTDLLASLYAGLDDAHPWQHFLETLAAWMNASHATLIITAPGKPAPATFVAPGSNPAFSDIYTSQLFANDPFQGLPDGEVTSYRAFMAALPDDAHMDYRRALSNSGYDLVLGMDLHFGVEQAQRSNAARYEARFRVSRHSSSPNFTPDERARFQALAPHLRIAVQLFERLQFAGAHSGAFHGTAQGLGLALAILDRNRQITSINPLAEQILAECEGIFRRDDVLVLKQSAQQRLLTDILSGAVAPTPLPRFRIVRPRHGDLILTARALDVSAIHAGAGALALFMARPGTRAGTDVIALRELLGLSPAEIRLVNEIVHGRTLVSAAQHLGIAYNTAKVQMRSIFAKTGVNRQAALVAMLSSLNS
jgi:DNA-binding CsgD family transcriptional regulator/PAS domain-containing protein